MRGPHARISDQPADSGPWRYTSSQRSKRWDQLPYAGDCPQQARVGANPGPFMRQRWMQFVVREQFDDALEAEGVALSALTHRMLELTIGMLFLIVVALEFGGLRS